MRSKTFSLLIAVVASLGASSPNAFAGTIQYDLVNVQDSAIGASITGFIDYDTGSQQFTNVYDLFIAPNATLGNASTVELNTGNLFTSGSSGQVLVSNNIVDGNMWRFYLDFVSPGGPNPPNTITLDASNSYVSDEGNIHQYALTGAAINDAVVSAPEPATTSLLLFGAIVMIGGRRLRR